MGLSHSPRIVTNGLVGCWDAGNPKSYPGSGTTWSDLSGNSLNGTLTSTTYSSGYLTFNGTSSTSNQGTSDVLNLTTALTIEVWAYPTGWGESNLGRFIERRGSGVGTPGYVFLLDNSTVTSGLRYVVNNGGAGNDYTIANSASLNVWQQFIVTHIGGTATIYKNGSVVGSSSVTQPTSTSATTCYIGVAGGSLLGVGRYFAGNLAAFKIYNRALSPQEVKQNFYATRGRYGI